MKNKLKILILILIALVAGCGNNNDEGGGNPFSPNLGGNNGNLSFEIMTKPGNQGGTIFLIKPSEDVKIEKVIVQIQNFTDEVNGDPNTVYKKDTWYELEEYTGVQQGQVWSFNIIGQLANTGKSFSVTVKYTVTAPGGGTGNVVIQISHRAGQDPNTTEFLFNPNVDITISKVDVQVSGFNDTLNGDGTTVFKKDTWYILGGYTGVTSGQQWKFTFYGKEAANGNDYTATSTYTIP